MRNFIKIGLLSLMALLAACNPYPSESEQMKASMEQARAVYGDGNLLVETDTALFIPGLAEASGYYAGKKAYGAAALAALYNGYSEMNFNKEAAMASFKEAERCGELAHDSLSMARAEYWIGKMLLDENRIQEALETLKIAERMGIELDEKALLDNLISVCYLLAGDFVNADDYLKQSWKIVEKGNNSLVKHKVQNNYAVYYRSLGQYDKAIECLMSLFDETGLNNNELLLLELNLGNVYFDLGNRDSSAFYYQRMEELLPIADVKPETKIAVYGALCRFAKSYGEWAKALEYREKHEDAMFEVMNQRQEQSVYRIQKQYDNEALRNTTNQKLIRNQRIIILVSLVAVLGLIAFAISRIKIAQISQKEAEARARLLLFTQQNQHLEQELFEEKTKLHQTSSEYAEKLTEKLKKEVSIMLSLHLFLENKGDMDLLKKLENSVFGKKKHIEAIMETIDCLYPSLRKTVKQNDLGLDEIEQMDIIMSYFNISRQDEALLLHKTTDMVDKIRNRSRKKLLLKSKSSECGSE